MIVETFAGPGGWDVALDRLGHRAIGIEWDHAACQTRAAAGLLTVRADVGTYPTSPFRNVVGFIGSPPCPAFSAAGKGHGSALVDQIVRHVHAEEWHARPHPDPEVWLVLDVGRWITDLNPEWITLEQVPAVLPIWRAIAHVLERRGYSVWCGILNAADYGVPQTRRRAILIASRTRTVAAPSATHDRAPVPSLFGELAPWVTMADALGWGMTERPGYTLAVGAKAGGVDLSGVGGSGARRGLHDERAAGRWILQTGLAWKPGGTRDDAQTIDPHTQPAPTVTAASGGQWHLKNRRDSDAWIEQEGERRNRTVSEPAPTITGEAHRWAWERPATTIACDPRVWPPGHKINADDIARLGADEAADRYGDRAGTEAIRLEVADALALQSFPPGYPVAGGKTKQFEQIGNAIPPLLAEHVLRVAIGVTV